MNLFRKKEKTPDPETYKNGRVYDYTTEESRVATAEWLFEQAKNERTAVEDGWVRNEGYYNFVHAAAAEMREALEEQGIDWTPAVVPDPFIQVESQLVPEVPQPEFHGRDDDADGEKARRREFAVRYIVEENRINDMNTSNERRLRKLGDAFWKAYWDETMPCGEQSGNIRIKDVSPEDFYPDPTAGREGLEACEYVDYVYTMHKLKFWRLYHDVLEKKGILLEDLLQTQYRVEDGLFEPVTSGTLARDDMVQILEHWYRNPCDTEEAPAGAIGCTMQAGGVEIKWIPNYWEKTGRQCRLFPFIHYWCIRDETQFWNRSELDPILSLVDAADRQIAIGQLNDAMMANDIVLVEEGALADGSEFTNVPGAQVTVKQGRMGGVARLGGLNNGIQSVSAVNWFLDQIQRTSRNYDSNNGRETARVTTASGLLQLRGDAETQQKLKKADRDAGFCRLYELLDWLALEYFDDDRLLFIGAKKKGEQPQSLTYNGDDFARRAGVRVDMLTAAVTDEGFDYYPRVDVTVTAGDGLSKNPATTVEVLDKLAASQITADNWELLAAELEYLDIPQKQEIIEGWRRKFAPTVPSEVTQALESDPELLAAVQEAVQANAAATEPAAMSDTEPDMAAGMMQGETAEIAVQPVDTQVVAAL
jgi:hypothetical protein